MKEEAKYSKKEFEGFTHRFKVQFTTVEKYPTNIDIYSNSNCYRELSEYINKHKTSKVLSFEIAHIATKEQDEASAKLIDEFLN